MHVKKNDKVVVITGKDKGTEGSVILTIAALNKVVVEGVNIKKRAIRGRAGKKGELVAVPMPIDASNVRLVDGKAKKAKKSAK